ncbi:MAG: helix-turn-helix domain-containing protein [Natronomonas sp.]
MGQGIRAEIRVDPEGSCQVARASSEASGATVSISRSVGMSDPSRMTGEFILDVENGVPETDDNLREVFDYGSKRVYRFDRSRGTGCPCELIEDHDVPVVDVLADDGILSLVFHAEDMVQLRDVITSLRDHYSTVDVRRLLRSHEDLTAPHVVFVDRGRLTDRQREVLETAHRMGYFDHPKGANAGDVASELDIGTSTFVEHLAAAQRKLLDSILDAG